MTKKITIVPNGEVNLLQAVEQIETNGEIIIQPGSYLIERTVKITKPMTIKNTSGNNKDVILSFSGGPAFFIDLSFVPKVENPVDWEKVKIDEVIGNVLLKDLTIVCQEGEEEVELDDYPSAVNVVSGRLILEGCDISSSERSGCSVRSADACIIAVHCEIHDTKDGGIFFDYEGSGLLQGCFIHETGLAAIDAEAGGDFMAIDCKILAGELSCIMLHDGGKGSCSNSVLVGNSFVNAIIITEDSEGKFKNCEIHEIESNAITEWQQDHENFFDCSFIAKDHESASLEKEEYSEDKYRESALIKEELMTTILGPPYDLVQHALIPYCVGGALDIYYYPAKNGTVLATQELVGPYFDKPSNREMNACELAMISKYSFDLKEDSGENEDKGINQENGTGDLEDGDSVKRENDRTLFQKDNDHMNTILNLLARYIETGAKLNHGDTLEFPVDFEEEDAAGRCFIFSRYAKPVKVPNSNKNFGIMVAIEIFRSEMVFAMQGKGKGELLLEMLNAAGIGFVSDLNRSPLVAFDNERQ